MSEASNGEVQVSVRDGVQVLRIVRPDKKNALTGAMYDTMREALQRAESDDEIICHVYIGSGGAFTAGNDISDFLARANRPIEPGQPIRAPSTDFIRTLPIVTKPMIAAVDGLAVGIGVTLLLHCDLVVASDRATFRAPFLDLGIIQEAGSSLTGPARLGHQAAFELLILGALWDAARAKEAGLVNWITEPEALEKHALAIASSLAGKPREALMQARRMMRGATPQATMETIEAEVQVYSRLFGSAEAREAFAAFLEKRKPDFARARAMAKSGGTGKS